MSLALLTPDEIIDRRIYVIRDQRIMLDRDLATLYGVKTIALRQQVKRNPDRFPKDFMFRLSKAETKLLVSQNVIPTARSFGGSLPPAFTEQGVAIGDLMKDVSPRAVQSGSSTLPDSCNY